MTTFSTLIGAATAVALFAAAPAAAATVALEREIQAGTIHASDMDMVVYYVRHAETFEVVATYVTDRDPTPARIQMALNDGDSVRFAMPDVRDVQLTFARDDDTVTITTDEAPRDVAKLNK